MDNTVGSLTQFQKSVVIGSLLGDDYLRKLKGRAHAFLEINHSLSQKDYVDWKYKVLDSVVASAPKQRASNGDRVAYRFFTRQHPDFDILLDQFYRNGTKVIPPGLELDPIILSVWYMDDGSKCRSRDVYLNTQQFSHECQELLCAKLAQFGLKTGLNKDKEYLRIRFLKESVDIFFDLIRPHVIEEMKYKLSKTS